MGEIATFLLDQKKHHIAFGHCISPGIPHRFFPNVTSAQNALDLMTYLLNLCTSFF